MYSSEELEALSYRELQKLAKKRKIRQSGKGITKKVLVSVLLDSITESADDSSETLPLQELEVKSFHPISSPEESSFEVCNFSDVERELNDSNKENNRRRLTYEISEPKPESPLVRATKSRKASSPHNEKTNEPKNMKRVRIHESPKSRLSTPKPHVKIVKTPLPNRKSSGRPGALVPTKTPSAAQHTPHVAKSSAMISSVKKTSLASHSKTPSTVQKTPRLNKAVLLRVASSVKKSAADKNRSRIPKLDVKKPPNFANIHQNAFEKMDSLWDVENQRNLRRRNVQSGGSAVVFSFKSKAEPPKKINSNGRTNQIPAASETAVFRFGSNNEPATKSTATINRFNTKDAACKAVNKLKPARAMQSRKNKEPS